MAAARDDEERALSLYDWNSDIASAFWPYLLAWEVTLRNRLNGILCQRHGGDWAFRSDGFLRSMRKSDREKIQSVIERRSQQTSSNDIVAGLTAGFWVGLLSNSYDTHLGWTKGVAPLAPNVAELHVRSLHEQHDLVLKFRNRIAHHEPIFHLNLPHIRALIGSLVRGMCLRTFESAERYCRVAEILLRERVDWTPQASRR
jgi:hypothetical protein